MFVFERTLDRGHVKTAFLEERTKAQRRSFVEELSCATTLPMLQTPQLPKTGLSTPSNLPSYFQWENFCGTSDPFLGSNEEFETSCTCNQSSFLTSPSCICGETVHTKSSECANRRNGKFLSIELLRFMHMRRGPWIPSDDFAAQVMNCGMSFFFLSHFPLLMTGPGVVWFLERKGLRRKF